MLYFRFELPCPKICIHHAYNIAGSEWRNETFFAAVGITVITPPIPRFFVHHPCTHPHSLRCVYPPIIRKLYKKKYATLFKLIDVSLASSDLPFHRPSLSPSSIFDLCDLFIWGLVFFNIISFILSTIIVIIFILIIWIWCFWVSLCFDFLAGMIYSLLIYRLRFWLGFVFWESHCIGIQENTNTR